MSKLPPATAKITRPTLVYTYPRTRLFRLLDRERKAPILWISGPAGCGKTTLVGSFLHARRSPCIWYQVDEGDQDIASLFYHLGIAARRAAPRKRKPLPLLTPEYLPGLATFSRRFFEGFFGHLTPGSAVVFDNYQKASAESRFHEVIRIGLSCLPEGINAFLISRDNPLPVFAWERAHQQMEVIPWKELRLTEEETKGIACLRGRKQWSGEEVRYLQSKSGGWAAGLVLLLQKVFKEDKGSLQLEDIGPEEVFEYFGSEIFENLDQGVKSFLLKSAFLPRATAPMADKITGQKRSGITLSYLNRHNYFTEKHPALDPVYQYHSLFRDFLLSRGEQVFSSREITRLRKCAASTLEEFGYAEEAAALYGEAGDWDGLTRVILGQAPALLGQGRNQTLSEWIGLLPKEVVGSHPWLLYWKGACQLPFDLVQSQRDLEEAFLIFRDRRDVSGVFLAWSGVVAAIAFGGEGIKPVDRWYPILEELIAEVGGFPSPQIEARVLISMLPSLGWRHPPDFDMGKWADRAFSLAEATPDIGVKAELLVHLALFWCYIGDFHQTDALVGSIRRLIKHPDVSTMVRLNAYHVELVVSIFHAEFDRCLGAASAGLSLAEESGVHFLDITFLGYGVLASLHRGDIAEANQLLEKITSRIDISTKLYRNFYHSVAAWVALGQGNLPGALSHVGTFEKYAGDLGYHVVDLVHHLQAALVHHMAGNHQRALHHLAESRQICAEQSISNYWFLYRLTEAYVSLGAGADKKGLSALREGVRIGKETGTFGVYISYPGFLERLCGRALEEAIEVEYVRELIRRNRVIPGKDQRDLEVWPWPLKIYTLDRFHLIRDGSPLSFSRKVQQRPLQLLKALIALGGRDVPEEQITDALWPDADGDQAHRSFSTTLHRLRRLIGHEKAASVREGRLTLDPARCWVDAWAFERTLGQVEKARRESNAGDGGQTYVRLAETAIGLYKGPFLGDEDFCPRIVQIRERLRTGFLRCISELGRHWEDAGKWDRAIDCYGTGLKAEGFFEEFFRRLMICYQRLGRNSEGLAVYHRCRKMLAKTLGRVPSPETEHIARGLR